jgi:hypothetical protein
MGQRHPKPEIQFEFEREISQNANANIMETTVHAANGNTPFGIGSHRKGGSLNESPEDDPG